jgi:hypothetical protein
MMSSTGSYRGPRVGAHRCFWYTRRRELRGDTHSLVLVLVSLQAVILSDLRTGGAVIPGTGGGGADAGKSVELGVQAQDRR